MRVNVAAESRAQFEQYVEIAEQRGCGIEIQEFCDPTVMDGDWKSLLLYYQERLRDFPGERALHNAFDGLLSSCGDAGVLALTRERYDLSLMIARELGVETVVSHFSWNSFATGPYLAGWQDDQLRFWESYVELAEKQDMLLVMENTAEPSPEILKQIIDRMGSSRFKLNMDVGHTNIFSEVPLQEWPRVFAEDLAYMHVHNNDGTCDAHASVLNGTVDYDELLDCLDELGIAPVLSTEVFGAGPLLESLDYLEGRMG